VWEGWHLWAEAVKKAGTTERGKVTEALESGLTFAGPEGTVKLDGPSHHLVHAVHLARTNDQKGFTIIGSQDAVPPSYEQSTCDLVKNPNTNQQFTPSA
jgi:branched-chain amino acid transport system substrate-binding protein